MNRATLMKRALTAGIGGLLSLSAASVLAVTDFPTRPISIVVPFPPGSISDISSRVIADRMGELLDQTVVVENKAGAGGIVGAQYVAKAKPDGYTLLLGTNSTNAINPSMYNTLPYNPATDFQPVSMTGVIPALIVARKDFPASDTKGVIEYAKQHPGEVRIAVGSTTSRVASEVFQIEAGIKAITVPYRGEPPGLTDLMGGQVDLMSLNLPTALPQLESGKIKPIGLIGATRIDLVPDIPRVGETLKSYTIPTGWNALFVPADTPNAIVQKLNHAVTKALKDPTVKEKLEATGGYVVTPTSTDELKEWVQRDAATWKDLIERSGVPKL